MKTSLNRRERRAIFAKIRALLAKTPDRGATEHEARSAWEKAQELMQRYEIAASEVGFDRMPDWLAGASADGTSDPKTSADFSDAGEATRFDYDALPQDVAATLRETATRIRESARKGVVAIGEELLVVKDLLKHGKFLKHFRAYLEAACHMSLRSAENRMAVALLLRDPKNAMFANLPVAGLYTLASRSTPEGARDTIRQLLAADHCPSVKYIQEIVDGTKGRDPKPPKEGTTPRANDQPFNCALSAFVELVLGHVPSEKWCLLSNYLVTLKNEPIKLLLDRIEHSIDRANRARAA